MPYYTIYMEFPLFLDTTSLGTGQVAILETINETTLNDINRAGLGKTLNLMERYY